MGVLTLGELPPPARHKLPSFCIRSINFTLPPPGIYAWRFLPRKKGRATKIESRISAPSAKMIGVGTLRLSSHFSLEAKLTYASNPLAPYPVLDMLAMDEAWVVRKKVAANPNIRSSTQELLSQDPYPEVRGELALNPNVLPSVVRKLLDDPEPVVRLALARNEHTDPDLLLPLAKDTFPPVREALAMRQNISPKLAEVLVQDPSMTVVLRLLANPFCPPNLGSSFLLKLPERKAIEVLGAIAPLPYAIQEELVNRGGVLLRAYLASAPWVDFSLWERLRNDPETFVRQAAGNNPAYNG